MSSGPLCLLLLVAHLFHLKRLEDMTVVTLAQPDSEEDGIEQVARNTDISSPTDTHLAHTRRR